MAKLNNIENLTDEELEARLEEESKVDLRADGSDDVKDDNSTIISGETIIDTNKNNRKKEKALTKEEKKQAKIRQKKIEKSKKYLKNHKVNIVRYEIDSENGLPLDVVNQRELDGLTNTTIRKTSKSVGKIIVSNVFTFFNMLILFIAATLITVGIMFKNYYTFTDLTFFLIVIVNTIIGIIQEINAKNIIDKLSLMSAPTANVIRGGQKKEIAVDDVVLDDLLVLSNGDQICADSIVLSGAIEVNESLLTGESNSIVKNKGDLLYSGSFVVAGSCNARVDKIGKDNYIEKLSSQARKYKKPKSDLLGSLNLIIKFMFIPIIILGFLLFMTMYYRSNLDLVTAIRKTAGAMIGMIPSGLFLMSSIAVTIGVIRLGQKNVLVQELYCIEMLARVNCICLDKTGTITDGTMSVKAVVDYDNYPGLATKNIVSAILNAMPSQNQTSKALIDKFGLGKRLESEEVIPFSSERKYSAVTFTSYGTFLMGAPEYVLKDVFKKYEKDVNKYSSLGYRIIAIAHIDGKISDNNIPSGDIKLISLILISDNIRPDAIETIKYFNESDVEVKVISGDNPVTVSKIATRAGVPNADKYISLEDMTDEEVRKIALRYNVFGRVTPNQKKILVESLKAANKTVAMTGDGVNDILALREADCSIAVASGSEAARNCSHLVLIDSNFGSMPFVVSEGRRVINNVTKVSTLFLTKTIFSLFLAIMGIIIGYYPISPSQLFMIDTLCIGLPSLLLVWEPNNTPVKGKFLYNVIKKALPGALTILLISLIVVGLAVSLGMDNMVRTTLIVIAATHTCMMVEFKEFKPFNLNRRIMFTICYGLFIFAIVFLPQLFEFKPITPFNEYYSTTLTSQRLVVTPSISISDDNYIVFNNKYLSNLDYSQTNLSNVSTLSLSATKKSDNKYYYTVSGITTSEEVVIPELSFDSMGEMYLGGYKISNATGSNINIDTLKIASDGSVYYTTKNNKNVYLEIYLDYENEYYNYTYPYGKNESESVTRTYSVMPTVSISNGAYIINGVQPSDGKYLVSNKLATEFYNTLTTKIEYNSEENYYYLTVNDETIYKTYNDSSKAKTPYIIELPTITVNDDKMYLEGVQSDLSLFEYLGEKTTVNVLLQDENGDVTNVDKTAYMLHDYNLDKDIIYIKDLKQFYEYDSESNLVQIDYEIDNYLSDGIEKSFNNDCTGFQAVVRNQTTIDSSSAKVSNYSIYYSSGTDTKIINPTQISFDNNIFSPKISKSVKDKYVIDGYYTSYDYSPSTTYNISLTSENYLVINGTVTNYQVSSNYISTSTGGMVHMLAIQYIILLLMLCFMAPYAIKLFQYIIPGIIQLLNSIKKLINHANNTVENNNNKKE